MESLPREPDEQLRVGLQIVERAYGEKTRQLEAEVQSLRAYGKERQSQVALLERRVSEVEVQVSQSEQRVRELASENASLHERLGKLDQFKRAIMQSINENDPPAGGTRAMLGEYSLRSSGLGYGSACGLGGGSGASGACAPRAYCTPACSPPSPSFAMRESAASAAPPTPSGTPLAPASAARHASPGDQPLDGKDFFRSGAARGETKNTLPRSQV